MPVSLPKRSTTATSLLSTLYTPVRAMRTSAAMTILWKYFTTADTALSSLSCSFFFISRLRQFTSEIMPNGPSSAFMTMTVSSFTEFSRAISFLRNTKRVESLS